MNIHQVKRSILAAAAAALLAAGAALAHSIVPDGAKDDWLSGFGSGGCPSLPAANASAIFSSNQGCLGPAGTEFIWTDATGDQRTEHWSGTGNLDLKEFRMTGDATNIHFMLEFADITDCSAQYIAIAINTNDATGTTNFPDNADTNLSGFGSGYERVVVANTTKTGYFIDNATYTEEGSSHCQESTNIWEISMPLGVLGMSWPAPSGAYDFATAIFCRETDGTICDVSGSSDLIDAITTAASTAAEVSDGNLGYNFTMQFNPTAVTVTRFTGRSAAMSKLPAVLGLAALTTAAAVLAWRRRKTSQT